MIKLAAQAAKAENPKILRVLGGISPIDPFFIKTLEIHGALENMNSIALHGFPLDWNPWQINEWPDKINEIKAVTDLPIWITEVGVSSFGAEEEQRDKTVAIVTHSDLIKATISYYAGIHLDMFQRLEIEPASVSIIEIGDETARILLLNHIGEINI